MKIMPNRLDRGFYQYQEEFEKKAVEVLRSGWYVLGKEVSSFEEEFAAYVGTKYCVGLASGLDALWLAFRVLGIGAGDEVIVQSNTYIASVMGITINGATPVFVEPDAYYGIDAAKIEEKITPRTKLCWRYICTDRHVRWTRSVRSRKNTDCIWSRTVRSRMEPCMTAK